MTRKPSKFYKTTEWENDTRLYFFDSEVKAKWFNRLFKRRGKKVNPVRRTFTKPYGWIFGERK